MPWPPRMYRRPARPFSAAAMIPAATSRTSTKSLPPGGANSPLPAATSRSIRPLEGFQSQGPSM